MQPRSPDPPVLWAGSVSPPPLGACGFLRPHQLPYCVLCLELTPRMGDRDQPSPGALSSSFHVQKWISVSLVLKIGATSAPSPPTGE